MEKEKGSCFFHEVSLTDEDDQLRTLKVPVVQELARQKNPILPERFIRLQPPDELPIIPSSYSQLHYASTEYDDNPPTINMANLALESEPEARTQELAKLVRAAKEWGLFLLDQHGIPSDVLLALEEVVKGFFSLSFEEKKAKVGTYSSIDNMGYGRNFVKSDDQPLDWIDRLTMRASPKTDTDGLRVWPLKPPHFREVMENYVDRARLVMDELLEALAEALILERSAFLQYFEPTESVINVRVNYYPPCPRPELVLGITPHSDASAFTLLVQFESTGGLQVFKDRQWITVQWPCDKLLVNVGDLLEIISNGRVQSPWHRVVVENDKERFSIALFYNPPLQAEINPVRDQDSNSSGYRKLVVEDYLQHFYKITPTKEKQAIMFAKS